MLKEKLLIVDDQDDLRKMLRLALGYGKYKLFEAADGETALAIARAEKPDVILLDVMMPGKLDGIAVCRAIKADPELAGCFVLMLTARGQASDYASGDAAGADAYMVKPFSPTKLVEVVEMRTRLDKPVRGYGF
ncbi:MAG: response regulator [Burkholderiaceae bacterium]|jgi:DNA-binding response OmpR family regulator|nr:response regulator [Sulfuritalea sp.]MCF8175234.1 response regulator [Burkholderiaceae bacterium]MCF8183348.1 response regulator [Polynucleobacter sp.]